MGREFQHGASFQLFSKDSFAGLRQELQSVLNACREKLSTDDQGKVETKQSGSVGLIERVFEQVSSDYDWRERQLSTDGYLDSVYSSHLLLLSDLPRPCLEKTKEEDPADAGRTTDPLLRVVDIVAQLRERVARRGCSAPRLVWVEANTRYSARSTSIDRLCSGLRTHESEHISFSAALAMDSVVDDLWGLKRNRRSLLRKMVTSPILNNVTSPIMFQSPSLNHYSNTPPTPYLNLSDSTPARTDAISEADDSTFWQANLKLHCVQGPQSLSISICPLQTAGNLMRQVTRNRHSGGGTGQLDTMNNQPTFGSQLSVPGKMDEEAIKILTVRGIMKLSAFRFNLVDSDKLLVHSTGASANLLTRLLRLLLSARSLALVDSDKGFGSCKSAVLIALNPSVAQLVPFHASKDCVSNPQVFQGLRHKYTENEFSRTLDPDIEDANLERLLQARIFAPSTCAQENSRIKMLYDKYENVLQTFLNKGSSQIPKLSTPVAVPDQGLQYLTKEAVLSRFKHEASRPLRDMSNREAVEHIQDTLLQLRKGLADCEGKSEGVGFQIMREFVNTEVLQPVRNVFSSSMSREDKREQYKRQVLLRLCTEALRPQIKDPIPGKSKLKAELAHLSFSMFGKEDPTQFRRFVDESLFQSFGTILPRTIHWIYDQFFSCEPSIEKKTLSTPMKALDLSSKRDILSNCSTNQKRRFPVDSEQRRKRRKTTSVVKELVPFGSLNVDAGLGTQSKSRKSLKKAGSSSDKPLEPKGADFKVEAVLTAKRGKGPLQAKRKLTLNHFTSGMSNMKALFKEVSYPQTATKSKRSLSENHVPNRSAGEESARAQQYAKARVKSRGRRFKKHRKNCVVSETPARSQSIPQYSGSIIQPTPGTNRNAHSRDLFRSLPETPNVTGMQYSKRAHALRRSATVVVETPMQAPQRRALRRSTSQLLWSSDDEA